MNGLVSAGARVLDFRDAVDARVESSAMWARVLAPVVLWAVTLGGAGLVGFALSDTPNGTDKWFLALIAALFLSLFVGTGATPRRGLPNPAGLIVGGLAALFVLTSAASSLQVGWRLLAALGVFVLVQRGRERAPAGAFPRALVWVAVTCVVFVFAAVTSGLYVSGRSVMGAALFGGVVGGLRLIVVQSANRRAALVKAMRREAAETGNWVGVPEAEPKSRLGRKLLAGAAIGGLAAAFKGSHHGSSNVSGALMGGLFVLLVVGLMPVFAVMFLSHVTGAPTMVVAALLVLGWVLAGRVGAWFPAGWENRKARSLGRDRAGRPVGGGAVSAPAVAVVTGAESVPTMLHDARVPTSLLVGQDPSGAWKGVTPHMVVVASSGSGKTRRIIAPNVISHDGPVVTATTKDDIALLTTSARARVGKVWWFDPSGSLPVPAGCEVARWSPLSLVFDKDSALRTAGNLITAGNIASGQSDTGKFFADQASEMLACLMLAAVIVKQGPDGAVRQMMTWLNSGPASWQDAEVALRNAGELDFAVRVKGLMDEAAGAGERRVADTVATARQILSVYRRDRVVLDADMPNLNLAEFAISPGDTIHIAMVADEQKALGPLIGLLCDAVIAARRAAPSESRDNIILLALDELASIPLTGLSSYLSEARSWGVRVLGGLQTLAQLDKWGTEGRSLKTLFPYSLIMNNCGDVDLLREVSEFQGEKVVLRQSRSQQDVSMVKAAFRAGVSGGHNLGASPTDSVSEQTERVLKIDEVTGLIPDGHVRLINGRRDLGVFYSPDVSEGVWGHVRAVSDAGLAADVAAAAETATMGPVAVPATVAAPVHGNAGIEASGAPDGAVTWNDMPVDPFEGVPFDLDEPFDDNDGR